MGDKTNILYSDATWNPVTGCTHAGSPSCDNCYARTMANRLQAMGQRNYVNGFKVTEHPHMLEVPLKWKRPRRIFVISMGDLFHEEVSDGFIAAIFGIMASCPQHTFQLLTKRPKRAKKWFDWIEIVSEFRVVRWAEKLGANVNSIIKYDWPLPNVWIGTTVENQLAADSRIVHLLEVPAAVRFISIEPMLQSIDLQEVSLGGTIRGDVFSKRYGPVTGPRPFRRVMSNGIDWVIVGGESGPKARVMSPSWVRSIRDQCQQANVPMVFKQWGEWVPISQVQMLDRHGDEIDLIRAGFRRRLVDRHEVYRTGKKKAGRRLDGILHEGYPRGQ